jgi:small subunit ribosomal protein S21
LLDGSPLKAVNSSSLGTLGFQFHFTHRGESDHVVEIRLEENEPIENALKRFKKVVQNSGLISEMKKREFYEKPSERRKKREAAARKKARRRAMKFNRD